MPSKKIAKRAPKPAPAKTRFTVELKFDLELDGSFDFPSWLTEKYKSFILGGLLKQQCSVPITLAPGSKVKIKRSGVVERGPVSFNWISFVDPADARPVRVFEDTLSTLDADGAVLMQTKVPR